MKTLFILLMFFATICEAQPYIILQARMDKVCYTSTFKTDTCYAVIALMSITSEHINIIEDGRRLTLPLKLYECKGKHIRILARDGQMWAVVNITEGNVNIKIESFLFENVGIMYDIVKNSKAKRDRVYLIEVFSTKTVNNNEY